MFCFSSLGKGGATRLPGPGTIIASSFQSPLDVLYLAAIFDPVFTASYSGLFKMFFDALDPNSLTGMPVLIGATAGTARHSLVLDHAMRPLLAYLRAVVVPTGVFAATEDFGSHGLSERIVRAAAELAREVLSQDQYGVGGFAPDLAARPRRTANTRVDTDVTPFSQLLHGHSGQD